MQTIQKDNWNAHWTAYSKATEKNPAQLYRHKIIFRYLKTQANASQSNIIDFGSGQGDMSVLIKSHLPQSSILGIELSKAGVDISQEKLPDAVFLERNLLKSDPIPDKYQKWGDYGICSEVLEHIDQPEQMLENMKGYLKPLAKIVFTVPGGAMSQFDKHIGHRKHYSKQDFCQLLEKCGYRICGAYSAGFPFFNLYRLVVIARGKRLIEDVKETNQNGFSTYLANSVMLAFRMLFPFNFTNTPWGWQILVIAEKTK